MLGAMKAVFCLMCLFAGETADVADQKPLPPLHQKIRSVSANVGQTVTLECFYDGGSITIAYWYKQKLGEKPKLMATFSPNSKTMTFNGEFQNHRRYSSPSENGTNRLMITDIQISDSAAYYCATKYEFAEGTTVLVQGPVEGLPVWVHQWASASNQSNGSVTLQCRVETGSCAGGARVYWLRESGEAEAGVLYAAGGSQQQQQCVKNASTQTHSCLYTLPMSPDPSQTGIYYCAVASCGRLLFGNGTKLDFAHERHSQALVISMGAALVFTSILSLSLAFSIFVMHRRSINPAPVTLKREDGGNQHDVHYAAIDIKKARRPRRRGEEAEFECVYSRVKQ